MTEKESLYLQLSEECSEVSHRISKLLRFGPDEVQEGNTIETNSERLRYEINDALAVLRLLEEYGYVNKPSTQELQEHYLMKREKVIRYLNYSKSLGIIK